MLRFALPILAAVLLLLAGISSGASGASGAASKRCGDVAGKRVPTSEGLILSDIRGRNIKCRTARSVAKEWRRSTDCAGAMMDIDSCTARGFACRQASSSGETSRWRCTRRSRTVSFQSGS